jgi:hypothetical protein
MLSGEDEADLLRLAPVLPWSQIATVADIKPA